MGITIIIFTGAVKKLKSNDNLQAPMATSTERFTAQRRQFGVITEMQVEALGLIYCGLFYLS